MRKTLRQVLENEQPCDIYEFSSNNGVQTSTISYVVNNPLREAVKIDSRLTVSEEMRRLGR